MTADLRRLVKIVEVL